ncbi:MAG: hypothetical protein ACT4QB_01270 [Gammaproteobacteria bacterium]
MGKNAGRYLIGELPQLDFGDGQFDLALCSHLLFLYSDQFTYEFHRSTIHEMLRVAREIRVFPLMTLMLQPSPYLAPLIRELESQGYVAQIQTVRYQIQRGGNQTLSIKRPSNSAFHTDAADRHAGELAR